MGTRPAGRTGADRASGVVRASDGRTRIFSPPPPPASMDARNALKWAAVYRGLSWAAGLVGLALALGPLYLYGKNGLGVGLVTAKVYSAPYLLVFVVLGFLVWQAVKTLAYYKTVAEAVDHQMAERFDPEMVKSDILATLDERLSDMQSELQRTRRSVEDASTSTASTGEAGGTSFDFQE